MTGEGEGAMCVIKEVRTGTEFRNSLPQCIRLIDKTRQDKDSEEEEEEEAESRVLAYLGDSCWVDVT